MQLVLCVYEKSQIQVSGTHQAAGPCVREVSGSGTMRVRRTFFAALDARTGKVIGQCHRAGRENSARSSQKVRGASRVGRAAAYSGTALERIAKLPRFHIHLAYQASWQNLLERWFEAEQLRRGDQVSGELGTVYREAWTSPGPGLLSDQDR